MHSQCDILYINGPANSSSPTGTQESDITRGKYKASEQIEYGQKQVNKCNNAPMIWHRVFVFNHWFHYIVFYGIIMDAFLFDFSFTMYLRLFIVMGVTWSMEGISFLISPENDLFLLTDICNTSQGVLIFVLFVMKRRVLRLIKKRFVFISSIATEDRPSNGNSINRKWFFPVMQFRWQSCFGKANNTGSVTTNSTSTTYATPNIVLNRTTSSNEKSKGTWEFTILLQRFQLARNIRGN